MAVCPSSHSYATISLGSIPVSGNAGNDMYVSNLNTYGQIFSSLNLFLFIHNLEIKGELWDYLTAAQAPTECTATYVPGSELHLFSSSSSRSG